MKVQSNDLIRVLKSTKRLKDVVYATLHSDGTTLTIEVTHDSHTLAWRIPAEGELPLSRMRVSELLSHPADTVVELTPKPSALLTPTRAALTKVIGHVRTAAIIAAANAAHNHKEGLVGLEVYGDDVGLLGKHSELTLFGMRPESAFTAYFNATLGNALKAAGAPTTVAIMPGVGDYTFTWDGGSVRSTLSSYTFDWRSFIQSLPAPQWSFSARGSNLLPDAKTIRLTGSVTRVTVCDHDNPTLVNGIETDVEGDATFGCTTIVPATFKRKDVVAVACMAREVQGHRMAVTRFTSDDATVYTSGLLIEEVGTTPPPKVELPYSVYIDSRAWSGALATVSTVTSLPLGTLLIQPTCVTLVAVGQHGELIYVEVAAEADAPFATLSFQVDFGKLHSFARGTVRIEASDRFIRFSQDSKSQEFSVYPSLLTPPPEWQRDEWLVPAEHVAACARAISAPSAGNPANHYATLWEHGAFAMGSQWFAWSHSCPAGDTVIISLAMLRTCAGLSDLCVEIRGGERWISGCADGVTIRWQVSDNALLLRHSDQTLQQIQDDTFAPPGCKEFTDIVDVGLFPLKVGTGMATFELGKEGRFDCLEVSGAAEYRNLCDVTAGKTAIVTVTLAAHSLSGAAKLFPAGRHTRLRLWTSRYGGAVLFTSMQRGLGFLAIGEQQYV